MTNDYSKFFSTYEAVEPPKYTKLNMEKYTKFNKKSIDNPYFHYSRTPAPVYNFVFNNEQDDEQNNELSNIPNIISNFGTAPSLNLLSLKSGELYNTLNRDEQRRIVLTNVSNLLFNEGFTDTLVFAILGNIAHESEIFNINSENSHSSAKGLFQMLDSEHKNFEKWDKLHPEYNGEPEYLRLTRYVADLFKRRDSNLLKAKPGTNTQQAWKDWNSGDIEKTTIAFENLYERSEDNKYTRRIKFANELAAAYKNGLEIIKDA